MKRKATIALAVALCMAVSALARPPAMHRGHAPAPIHHYHRIHHTHAPYHHHHHHSSGWGRGGRNFWPGMAGGVVGGMLWNEFHRPSTFTGTVPVVATPMFTTTYATAPQLVGDPLVQYVWIPGRYVDQIQVNGAIMRVWVPGHWETRHILAQ